MKIRISWGIGITIAYSLFALGTLSFVVFAAEQKIDLVSPDYYERALQQDRQTTASANALSLGDRVAVDVADDASRLTVTWPGEPRMTSGTITLYRASDSAADRVIPAAPDAQSRQRVDVSTCTRGHWRVQLRWTASGREYYVEREIVLR